MRKFSTHHARPCRESRRQAGAAPCPLGRSWGSQQPMTKESFMEANPDEDCLDACNECANACDLCAAACLREDEVTMMASCIAHDIDCAHLCRTAAGFIARGSAMANAVCQACAAMCEVCADECARHTAQHCQACAAACRRCAEQCRRMVADRGVSQASGRAPAFRTQ